MEPENAAEYEVVDMRRDLMLLVHDNQQHPTLGRTLQQLREVACRSAMASRHGKDSEHCININYVRDIS